MRRQTALTPSLGQLEAHVAREEKKAKRWSHLSDIASTQESRLLGLINQTLHNREEAQDVLQDVLEDYVETYDVGTAIESAGAWLARVAKNKVIDRFRKKKNQNEYAQSVLAEEEADLGFGAGPDADLERLWLNAELVEALEALPAEQRAVFVAQEIEGKTFEQIAQESGVNINTLLARKRYAVNFLRDYLKEIYDEYE